MNRMETRLGEVMRDALPPIEARPDLAGRAIGRARGERRRRTVVGGATAAVLAGALVTGLVPLDGPVETAASAVEWSGCADASYQRWQAVGTSVAGEDPVALAVCVDVRGEAPAPWPTNKSERPPDGSAVDSGDTVTVHVAGADTARQLLDILAAAQHGMDIDSCAYEACRETFFAVRFADGAVQRFQYTAMGTNGGFVYSGQSGWMVPRALGEVLREVGETDGVAVRVT